MPRTGKGAKPNRTDLNQAAPTGDDREYGSNARDEAALAAVPMQQQPVIEPGSLGPLAAPTAHPERPITHGVDIGPGAGSEARLAPPSAGYQTPLERAAEMTGNPRLRHLVGRRHG